MYPADVLVGDGKFLAIGEASQWNCAQAECIDLCQRLLLPGCIDAHCHIQLDTGSFATPDNWLLGSQEAALGGITTVIDFVSPLPQQSLSEALRERQEQAAQSIVDYQFHMTIMGDPELRLAQMPELPALGCSSLKLYTTYRPTYYNDDVAIVRILKQAAKLGLVSLVHCENDAIVSDAGTALKQDQQTALRFHPLSRPECAELEAVARILRLAQHAQACVVIAHNSCAQTPALVMEAKRQGVHAYCESAPQYLYLDDSRYHNPQDAWRYILQPPLRSRNNVDGLRACLKDKSIDMLITDHCAYSKAQKTQTAQFYTTPGGLPGLQTLLPLSAALPGVGWPELTKLLSEAPAKIYGLWPQKGCIQVGADADFIILRDETYTIDEHMLQGCAQYSPFHGLRARGVIDAVYKGGVCLVQEGALVQEAPRGSYLRAKTLRDGADAY